MCEHKGMAFDFQRCKFVTPARELWRFQIRISKWIVGVDGLQAEAEIFSRPRCLCRKQGQRQEVIVLVLGFHKLHKEHSSDELALVKPSPPAATAIFCAHVALRKGEQDLESAMQCAATEVAITDLNFTKSMSRLHWAPAKAVKALHARQMSYTLDKSTSLYAQACTNTL
jgi:hypothetical protein